MGLDKCFTSSVVQWRIGWYLNTWFASSHSSWGISCCGRMFATYTCDPYLFPHQGSFNGSTFRICNIPYGFKPIHKIIGPLICYKLLKCQRVWVISVNRFAILLQCSAPCRIGFRENLPVSSVKLWYRDYLKKNLVRDHWSSQLKLVEKDDLSGK